jgi:hypothetical protein
VVSIGKQLKPFGSEDMFAKNFKAINLTCSPTDIYNAYIKMHFEEQKLRDYTSVCPTTLTNCVKKIIII